MNDSLLQIWHFQTKQLEQLGMLEWHFDLKFEAFFCYRPDDSPHFTCEQKWPKNFFYPIAWNTLYNWQIVELLYLEALMTCE